MSARFPRLRIAAIVLVALVAFLALTWPVLGQRYAYALASFYPEFRYVRAGTLLEEAHGHFGRVALACGDRRLGVLLLHAAGFRDPRAPYKPVSAMACAASRGHVDMLKLLAWLGDDVNQCAVPFEGHLGTFVTTPLGAAIAAKQMAAAEFLMQHGASPMSPSQCPPQSTQPR